MKKVLFTILLVLAAGVLSAEEKIIASWDFSTKDPLSSGSAKLKLRGKAVIQNGMLISSNTDMNKPSGAVVTDKDFQKLTPKGAFTLSVDFTMKSNWVHPAKQYRYFFDTKYVETKKYHKGFMFFLVEAGGNKFIPGAAFGFGDKSAMVWGRKIELKQDVPHTAELIFTGTGKVAFVIDGTFCGNGRVPKGNIVPSNNKPTLGDRIGGNYSPSGCGISRIVLKELPSQKGSDCLAQWDFSQSNPLISCSTELKLRGKSVIENGMLISSGLEISKPSGAIVQDSSFRELTPKGAFSLAVAFKLNPRWVHPKGHKRYFFDTKYVEYKANYHKGFMFFLTDAGKDLFYPEAIFGLGDKSAGARGKKIELKPDVLHTAELIFTGTGKVSFVIDGKPCGESKIPAGTIVPSNFKPVIGDRFGSNYGPFGGAIQKVVLKELPFEPLAMIRDAKTRTVFERGEKGKSLCFQLLNISQDNAENITVNAFCGKLKFGSVKTGSIAAGKSIAFQIPVDTLLIPGSYTLNLEAVDAQGKKIASAAEGFTVVPAYGDFMPVVLWGKITELKMVADTGFTHQCWTVFPYKGEFAERVISKHVQDLDNNLKNGLYVYSALHLNERFAKKGLYLRKDRAGKDYPRRNVESYRPEVRKEVVRVVTDTAKALGDHPGWDSVLSNSETRDSSNPSFTGMEEAAFKKYAGFDVPADVTSKYPRGYETYPEYPWTRVLPAKDPRLTYFSWFWRTGDGWNDFHTLVTQTLHKYIKHHFWVFYDPVVRVPAQWGSGGGVDVVSQWTYTNPDPIKIGQATDEVIAMAQGRKGQKPMSMTQIIWYRNETAPMNQEVKNTPEWVKKEPKARFITIPPDCIREALWCKVARRLDGIMYHGGDSLFPVKARWSYRYTNPESQFALKEVLHRVVKPLGPALKAIPEREPEVAILENFASSIFARQHVSLGWSKNWVADLHLALQWAHFQPHILYEEHLLNNMQGSKLKVLFLPGIEVVTDKLAVKLRELQKKGLILVGDEFTCPGISPDFRIKSVQRITKDPAGSKAAFQKLGREIAAMLKPYYQSPFDASSPEIVVRRRGSDSADYVFLVNDKRTFGNYLGQWGLVMEKGLPVKGSVTVNHPAGAAYDVVNHKAIPFKSVKGKTVFDVALGAGDGALILLTEKPVGGIDMKLPSSAVEKGGAFEITFRVKDSSGKTVKSVMPIEITLTASDGVRLPGSGFYAACDGVYTLKEIAATNMKPGAVKVTVRDLASGKTANGSFQVK